MRSVIDLAMYYAYILRSEADPSQIYKGLTEDIEKRLDYHNSGKVYHTAKYKPWRMVFYAAFETRELAADFEKYLKTASGIAFLRKRFINN